MGRAIDMEKDINKLNGKFDKLENTIRGMLSKLDELDDKSTKTKHIDLTEIKDDKKETKKANNKGNGKGNKSDDSDGGKPKSKTK